MLDFADLSALADAITAFIQDWNAHAHPFRWSPASFDTLIAKVEAALGLIPTPEAPNGVPYCEERY